MAAPAPPVADFTCTPLSGQAPLAVSCTDSSTGSPTSWAWDMDNDGVTEYTTQNVVHTYNSAGLYSVKLTATNAEGSHSLTRAGYINVNGTPPPGAAAQPKGIYVVDDGDPDFASALAHVNVDGALIRYRWTSGEPSDDNFVFRTLCTKLNNAIAAGKSVTIANFALTPTWLENQLAGELWTHPQSGTQVVPWSVTGQAELDEYANALANHVCPSQTLPIKQLTASIKHISAAILGMQGIRQAPSTDITTLTDAVKASVNIWINAFGGDQAFHYYNTLFPLSGCCGGGSVADAEAIRDGILAEHPEHNFFAENWTGAGPHATGNHGKVLDANVSPRPFHVMLQACGYWYDQTRIGCNFDNTPEPDSPQKGYEQIAGPLYDADYLEIYPDDILWPDFQDDFDNIHTAVWQ
ncbi:MAG: PKD domain-containing protein [Gammaproteobacteria bacterium]|nr:PKD domain-containing protein [Gammaproteobacteria bacterium]